MHLAKNPREAATVFRHPPKQKNVFLVRFHANGSQSGADIYALQQLSFVAKSIDRPKVNPKTEELNQYNKKRQVYTGFKLDPVRVQFYDSADGAAMKMWQQYSEYYFGDFYPNRNVGYHYDVIGKEFFGGMNYGFQPAKDGEGQFFFSSIELLHFNNNVVQVYLLTNPRITMFEPDDLDYENSGISIISMSFVYENLQYMTTTQANLELPEFASGASFDGQVPQIVNPYPDLQQGDHFSGLSDVVSSSSPVTNLLSSTQGIMGDIADYRYNNTDLGGALGGFGNFAFGPGGNDSLYQMGMSNTPLAAVMDVGVNPFSVTRSLQSVVNTMMNRGINSVLYGVARSQATAMTSGHGPASSILTGALLAANALNAGGPVVSSNGVTLMPQAYGAINARQTGTAQYGYNPNTDPWHIAVTGLTNDLAQSIDPGWGTAANPQY